MTVSTNLGSVSHKTMNVMAKDLEDTSKQIVVQAVRNQFRFIGDNVDFYSKVIHIFRSHLN